MPDSQPHTEKSSTQSSPGPNMDNYGPASRWGARSASGKAVVIISFTASMVAVVFALVTRKQLVAPLQKLVPPTTIAAPTPNQTWASGSQPAPSFALQNQNKILIHGPMVAKSPTLLVFSTGSCNSSCQKTFSIVGSVETKSSLPIVIISNKAYSSSNSQVHLISQELNLGSTTTNWNWLSSTSSAEKSVVKNYSNIVAAGSLNGSVFVLGPRGNLRYFWPNINSANLLTNAIANS